jgi:hypothetical protein
MTKSTGVGRGGRRDGAGRKPSLATVARREAIAQLNALPITAVAERNRVVDELQAALQRIREAPE